jgi:hypothetical protein
MSNVEKAGPHGPISSSPPRTWDFLETTLGALIADGVFMLSGLYVMTFAFQAYGAIGACSPVQLQAIWQGLQGCWLGIYLISGVVPAIAVLWVAIRMADREFGEYLALNWPTPREAVRAFGIMAVVIGCESLLVHLAGAKSGANHIELAVGGQLGLMIMLVGVCIAAPIVEEFVVRGFMFRGWSQSFLGPTGAILLTSAVWAMNHTQYDWLGRLVIFVDGLALGHFRWRSNSTWLTVMVHSALNTFVSFTIGPYV